ncbi:MAG: hypothetical protein EOL95_10995, partial [Bacteroidia bacterium]|nr:hypothetical protein [Bacteroidia bacterium]
MATWSRDKVDSSTINSGNEYELQDRVSREQLNSMVNSGLYSQDFAEHLSDTPDTTNAGVVGTPNVELIDNVVGGKTYKKFKFSNLKGLTGNGISTVAKTSTSGLTDTYTITFTSGATTTFNVKNGKGINTIVKTGTVGIVDTYTITFNDSTTTTFMVSNGKGISSISKTGTSGLVDTYTITFNDSTTQTFTVTNGAKGDTGEGVPSGGTTGQIIKKTATSTEWANEYDGSNKVDKTTTGTLRRVYGVNASNVQELTEIETTPTSSSTKLITSGGIKTELDLKAKVDA